MTFFEKNLAYLISQGFEEKVLDPYEPSSVSLIKGKSGYYTATKLTEGQEILLHSAYDPLGEASVLIDEGDTASYQSIFLFGLGLGYHLIKLLDQTPKSTLIFVLETDWDIVKAAMKVIDFEEILSTGRVVLAFGKPLEIKAILDRLFVMGEVILKLQRTGFLYFPPKYRVELPSVQEMRNLVLEEVQYHHHALGKNLGWPVQGLTNLVKHLPYLIKSPTLNRIFDTWHKPVVIVLAGPSLNKNIAVLKEWQDRVTIFCVNTVFNKLLDFGIIPDATFSLDRTPTIPEKHYMRDEPIPDSIVFVANPVVDSRSASAFKHHLFIFSSAESFEHELANDLGSGVLSMGLSVTHFAFAFAYHIGAPAIILIGQDLAFGEEGRTHSSGSVYDKVKVDIEKELEIVYLEGYYGEKVPSQVTWRMFRDWYEIFLERYPTLLINATEGGVRIKGTVQMTLQEAMEEYVGIDSTEKDSFVDWLASVSQDILYDDRIETIKTSFMSRIKKLSIAEQVYTRAANMYSFIEDANMSTEIKKRYLNQMYQTAYDILTDEWIYSLFRPEYISRMGAYINLNNGSMDDHDEEMIIKKAILLQEMFKDLTTFLNKLKKILEDKVPELDQEEKLS
ncbi:hypothetical protein Desaci_3846 [Desulfosporosinus acidiphilus SJ4]|uniref:Motility accessory factor n=1 Tax=Desulfosporosinus acidiphilus (strain DSM 22704 / JCM 16185 / SJ4) TaxID=646529 RepID=I4DAA3_DESAJ|nr:6-hydroxymethylpterin diphosphokinase MptE-like protein [Desulfosporosinus acidiphilus]AFM42727.1 hypothetical protein Desaci_3846 [Desulfosporosinus acidiphilus SJ4]